MAGFMAKGLGFSSTIGSAITGAAREGSAQMAEGRQQERQNELMDEVWANKADNNAKQWAADKKSYTNRAALRDSIMKNYTNGDAGVADSIMGFADNNPKLIEEWGKDPSGMIYLINNAKKSPEGYQSNYMDKLSGEANENFQRSQGPYNRLRPETQGRMSPLTPWDTPQGPASGGTPNVPSATPIGQPQELAPQSPPLPDTTGSIDANGAPQSQPAATTAPMSPIASPSAPTGDVPQQVAQAQPGQLPPFAGKARTMTPYENEHLKIMRGNQQQQNDLNPNNPVNLNRKNQAQFDLNDAEKYFHDPKTGLQARYNDISTLAQQNMSSSSMVDILNRGFKASSVQGAYDELNRFTTGALGFSLADLGVSNTVSDVQTLKKDIANGVISKLSTLHFGRITNYEAQMVKQGFAGTNNDPNTNIKIALTMQAITRRAMDRVTSEYNAANSDPRAPFVDRMIAGKTVASQFDQKFNNSQSNAPWIQISNAHSPSEADKALVAKVQPGEYYEDKSTGIMYPRGANATK